MADPAGILTSMSVGLRLVDQFRELTLRFIGKPPTPPGTIAEQSGDAIQITTHQGAVVDTITVEQMHLDEWDQVRYRALERRIKLNWDLYYELYSQLPELSVDECARITARVEKIKEELCYDFREKVRIYERVLGTALPDHYSLYEVCQ